MTGSNSRINSDEYYVIGLCNEVLGRVAKQQHRFDFLRGDTGRKLPVDAYYEDLNLVIEYCEIQHTEPVAFFDNKPTASGVPRGKQRKKYDARRREILPKHGIKVINIHYSDFGTSKKLKRNYEKDKKVVANILKPYIEGPIKTGNNIYKKIFFISLISVLLIMFALGHCRPTGSKQQEQTSISSTKHQSIVSTSQTTRQQPKETAKPRYHYKLNVRTKQTEELYEVENAGKYVKVKKRKYGNIGIPDGHYEWDADVLLKTEKEMYEYLKKHYKEIKDNSFDEISYYEDMRDDYLDDPEDEIRFPPEIFETLDD